MHGDGQGFVEDDARASQLVIGLNGAARVSDGEPGELTECHVARSFLSFSLPLGQMLLLAVTPAASRAPCAVPLSET